jgi:hypothetical protein
VEAFEQLAVCMFGYMTELDTVSIDVECGREIVATGQAYLFLLLLLFCFCLCVGVCRCVSVCVGVRRCVTVCDCV